MFNRMLVAAGFVAAVAVPGIAAADAPAPAPAPAAAAPAAPVCDPYKDYSCLDKYLGTGFWERLVNYYDLEWNQAGPPTDPKAPPGRREGFPNSPTTTPPMPFTDWPYGGTEALGDTLPGSIDSPFMTAIANTALGNWMADNHFQFYGWVNAGANISTSTVKPGGNFPAAYSYNPNEVQLDQVVVYWDRFPDTVQKDHMDWGMRLSAIYGETYRYTTAYGFDSFQLLNKNRANGYDFPMIWGELYFPQVANGLMLRAGRYISVPDIEAQLAPNNYMYSHSMTYAFDNYTNTGIIGTLAVTPQFFVQAAVAVGTEATIMHMHETVGNPTQYVTLPGYGTIKNPLFPDASFKKDPGAMPSYTLCGRYSSMSGDDDVNVCVDALNKGTWGYNNLMWAGLTAYHKFNDKWHISWEGYHIYIKDVPNLNNPIVQALNATYGTDGGTPFSSLQGIRFNNPNEAYCLGNFSSVGGPLTCTANWTASVAYINYSPDPLNNFSIRPEWIYDAQGQRSGTPTHYGNLAFGWQHWFGPQLEVRPEVALYHSFNAPAFNGNFNAGIPTATKQEVILSGDFIFHF